MRKVCFSKAFVVDYSESYSNHTGNGTFTLYVRQFFDKEILVISEETIRVSNTVTKVANTIKEPVEVIQEKVALLSPSLNLKKKNTNITD